MSEAGPSNAAREGTGPMDTEAQPRVDTIASWREEGYRDPFRVIPGARITCESCAQEFEPEQFRIDRTGRYEGATNPGDEELLLALSCGSCGHRGTLILAYGPYASADEAEVARRLKDARPQ